MLTPTAHQREKERSERARLKIGDRVVVIPHCNRERIHIGTVEEVGPQCVRVALTKEWITRYRIEDGLELNEFPISRLRGLATRRELESARPGARKKDSGTLQRVAKGQARTFRQRKWPQILDENRHHRQDKPGINLDEGSYANQLRYHDSQGELRGRLLFFHEAKSEKPVDEWDCYRGEHGEPGNAWIDVDPKRQLKGIATALLNEAYRRNWPIDLDKQGYTLAGAAFIRKYRKSSGR